MAGLSGGEEAREGLFAALKNMLLTLLAIGKTRAELLVNEIEEEKFRVMALAAKAVGAAFLLALGIVMAVACLASAFWEQRIAVFGVLALLFAGLAWWLLVSLREQLAQPSKLFRASLSELQADMEQLARHRNSQE